MIRLAVLLVVCSLAAAPALATDLVYRPVNPNFGGDPLNGPNLLNSANAQNHFKDPKAGQFGPGTFGGTSTVQQFAETLQRAILGRIASAISGSVVDASGDLIPGTVTIGSLTVTIVDLGTSWSITTLDSASGQSTMFEVPK